MVFTKAVVENKVFQLIGMLKRVDVALQRKKNQDAVLQRKKNQDAALQRKMKKKNVAK